MAVAVHALQVADEFLHIVDIVVEVERPVRQRHGAGVFPVGDVDLVVFEHGFDGVAQQRGVVARQRGHDQHRRLAFELAQRRHVVRKPLEAAQFAKRLVQLDFFVNGDIHPVHIHRVDAKCWLFIVFAQAVHQVVAGGQALHHGQLRQRRVFLGQHLGSGLRQVHKRLHQRALGFVELIQHGMNL